MPAAPAVLVDTGAWAHPDVMIELREVRLGASAENPAAWQAAIAKARPALATDPDVQLQVGDMLISMGDPIDGLAWQLSLG